MFPLRIDSLQTLLELAALLVALMLVAGILRFILRLAWRFVNLVLTLVVLVGLALILMQFIQIR
jgi:hypothetical protein